MKTVLVLMLFALPALVEASPSQQPEAVEDYLQIQSLLARDNFQGVTETAKLFYKDAKALPNGKEISGEAEKLVKAKDLTQARAAFIPVSNLMKDWAKKTHAKNIYVVYCPMKEAYWLQKTAKVENPYYGKEMLECGVIEQ